MEKIQKISRNLHDKLRRKAVLFEREKNNGSILLIPCDGEKGWYETGDASALLYKYEVCDKIGVSVQLKDDYDTFYNQYDVGRIRTQHPETVVEHVKRAGLMKAVAEKDHCVIIELNKKYTKMQLEQLREEEKQRQAEINDIVETKVLDPTLKVLLTEVSARMHRLCLTKLDKTSRDTNGRRIVERCDKALMAYYYIASLSESSDEAVLTMWKKLREHVFAIEVEMQIIVDLKLWKRVQVVTLGETVVEIEDRVDKHIVKLTERVNKRVKKGGTSRLGSDCRGDASIRTKTVAADSAN